MNFTAIDFETASGNVPCEIGICVVREGKIAETRSWFIKPSCFPYMNFWNQNVHGISNSMIENALTFDSLWNRTIKFYLQDQLLVAHNAPFDIGVLKATLTHYEIQPPGFSYLCSCQLSRRVWKEFPKHGLGYLCQEMGIFFNHHRAGADAEACAKIVILAAEKLGVKNLEDLALKSGTKIMNKEEKHQ
jgi:DNA polymerase-3 subunit epsilon